MELGAGPAGAGVGAEGGVWKLGAAGHRLGGAWFLKTGSTGGGSQGTGLGAEGGVWRRPRIVGRALGRDLVVWGRGQDVGWAVWGTGVLDPAVCAHQG